MDLALVTTAAAAAVGPLLDWLTNYKLAETAISGTVSNWAHQLAELVRQKGVGVVVGRLTEGQLPANHHVASASSAALRRALLWMAHELAGQTPAEFHGDILRRLERGEPPSEIELLRVPAETTAWVHGLIKLARNDTQLKQFEQRALSHIELQRLLQSHSDLDNAADLHDRVRTWLGQQLSGIGTAPDQLGEFLSVGWPLSGSPERLTLYQAWCVCFREQVKDKSEVFNSFVATALADLLQRPAEPVDFAHAFEEHLKLPLSRLLDLAQQTLEKAGRIETSVAEISTLLKSERATAGAPRVTLAQAIDEERLDTAQQALLDRLLEDDTEVPDVATVQAAFEAPVRGLRGYLLRRVALACSHQGSSLWLDGGGIRLDTDFVNLDLLTELTDDGAPLRTERRYGSLDELFDAHPPVDVWCLVGEPGGGKTTLMQHREMQRARALLRALRSPAEGVAARPELCIWMRLSTYRRGPAGDGKALDWPDCDTWLEARWAGDDASRVLPALAVLRRRFKLRFLLDGINEIEPGIDPARRQEAMRGFARWALAHKATQAAPLFSVRGHDIGSATLHAERLAVRQVKLARWRRDQVEKYCQRDGGRYSELWERLSQDKDPRLLELCRLPFNLAAQCALHDAGFTAEDRADLFLGLTWLALRRAWSKGELAAPGLLGKRDHSKLANNSHWLKYRRALPREGSLLRGLVQQAEDMAHQVSMPFDAAARWNWPAFDREAWLAAVQALGVAELRSNDVGDQFAVTHQLWLEFFTALGLAEQPSRAAEMAALPLPALGAVRAGLKPQEPLPGPDALPWEEAAKMAVQLASQPDAWLSALAPVNLALAGRAAAGCLKRVDPTLCQQLRADLLARSRDPQTDLRLRIEAAEALGLMGDTLRYEEHVGATDRRPRYRWPVRATAAAPAGDGPFEGWLQVPAGTYLIGSRRGEADADDDEFGPDGQPLAVELQAFEIGFAPVTNAEFAYFVRDQGYENEAWWPDGPPRQWWRGELRDEEGRNRLMRLHAALVENFEQGLADHWRDPTENNREWAQWLRGLTPAQAQRQVDAWYPAGRLRQPEFWESSLYGRELQPVVGVSLFEAEAYCRWLSAQTGREVRLPTEAEWEAAVRRARPGGARRRWPLGGRQLRRRAPECRPGPIAAGQPGRRFSPR